MRNSFFALGVLVISSSLVGQTKPQPKPVQMPKPGPSVRMFSPKPATVRMPDYVRFPRMCAQVQLIHMPKAEKLNEIAAK